MWVVQNKREGCSTLSTFHIGSGLIVPIFTPGKDINVGRTSKSVDCFNRKDSALSDPIAVEAIIQNHTSNPPARRFVLAETPISAMVKNFTLSFLR